MEMPVPIRSSEPYSADSEGSIPREFMDTQEQQPTSHATRLSQDVVTNENAVLHNSSIVKSPKSATEPRMRESPTSTIPFPSINIAPATPLGSIQKPKIAGAQGQQERSARHSQLRASLRGTAQDPGPSNQHPQGSLYRQSHQEPALEPSQYAPDAQEPHQSLYSGEQERRSGITDSLCSPEPLTSDQILRDFVVAQEQLSPESHCTSVSTRGEAHRRSSRASQRPRAVIETVGDPGPSTRHSRQHSRSYNEITISGATTTEEVMRQLKEQKKETSILRRALRLASERVDAENQRTAALERSNVQAIEQFLTLNESRLAAQQEALKAGSELRVYQFQLENARKEIERAQEMARTLENQRHEAEEAASRSRAEVRKHAQAHMVAAAKEEGRRLGFEAGLRRAEEEAVYLDLRSGHASVSGSRVHEVTALPADFDLDLAMSSPVRRRTRRAHSHREIVSTPPQPQIQSPTPPQSEESVEEEVQPPRTSDSAPDIIRAASPGSSVLRYPVSIPPASEIEQQNSPMQYPSESSQPWVTAREYHHITGTQPSPENVNRANAPNPFGNVVTFAPDPLQGNHQKKKTSWLRRTLTLPWRRKASRAVQEETPSSWYQPTPFNQPPNVRIRGSAATGHEPPRTSADHTSVSTHFSQFDLVRPPPDAPGPSYGNPTEGTPSLAGSAIQGKRRTRDRSPLHIIDEDSSNLNEILPPLRRDIPPLSPSMGRIRELLGDAGSNYSDPRAVDEWRRSSASQSIATVTETSQRRVVKPPSFVSGQTGPPRRRPVHLTVPQPLAPQAANPPPSSTIPGSSLQNPALLGVSDVRPSLQRNPTLGTVYGFTIEPPSRSPTEAPNSARPLQENLLSPNPSYAPSLRSMVQSLPNNRSSGARNSTTPLIFDSSRVSGHSQAPPLQPNSPTTQASSRSLAPTDHLHRSSVASHAATHAPPRSMTDNASVRSGPRSVNAGRNVPPQDYSYPAPANPNPTSHQRNVSDLSHLIPNGYLPGVDGNAKGVHDLHRVASNQSMNSIRSANSQYSRFDPNAYVEPTALYDPVSVGPSRQRERQRTMSNVTGTTLSYIS